MDIFDRLFQLPVLRILEPFYKRYKEVLLYLFFGGLTFVISVVSYAAFTEGLGWNELIANLFSWVFAVLFAFFTNRIWVFQAAVKGGKAFLQQMLSFFGGRVFTLVVEEVILLIFITWLGLPGVWVKVAAQVVVIILNYVISKLFVFRKENR